MFSCALRIILFLLTIIVLQASLATVYAADTSPWETVCPDGSVTYCKNVGKNAHNRSGPPKLKEQKLGKIIGVTWRAKGSLITTTCPTTTSPRDAYYYIITDGIAGTIPVLRQCEEIDAK